jgi:flagellar assembly protein FliH
MAGIVIPKEQQSAYQRWELGSFETPANAPARPSSSATAAADQHAQQSKLRARGEGYTEGHRAGLEAARREVLAEMAPRIARMDELLAALTTDLARVDREVAKDVVQLALAVARNLVGASLKVRPELVQNCVEEALRHVAHGSGAVFLTVHPEDAALVKSFLEASSRSASWSIREDETVARGGCRVETAGGEIDATLEQRWHRTTAALGQPLDWIE